MEEESEKAGLKLNIQKTKITTSSHITSQQTGGKVEAMTDFIFLGSKITTGGDYSHEIKRHLFLEEKLWQSTPVFLPEESHGQRSLAGYNPWDHKESDMTE